MHLRPILVSAFHAIRTWWKTTALLAAAGLLALAATLPVLALAGGPPASLALELAPDLGLYWTFIAHTITDTRNEAVRLLFILLLVGAAGALMVAAVTLFSFAASRAAERRTDITVRRAVGASRKVLGLSLLTEGVAIAALAVIPGIILAMLLLGMGGSEWPGRFTPGATWQAAGVIILIVAGIVMGALVPLALAPRKRITGNEGKPPELVAVAVQLGVSLIILTLGSLLTGSHLSRPAGSSGVTGDVYRIEAQENDPAERAARYASLLDTLHQGGTVLASLGSAGALTGMGVINNITTDCGSCSVGGLRNRFHDLFAAHQFVSADTFQAVGIPLIKGRSITRSDDWSASRVAVVSRQLARSHFQNGDAIGRRMRVGGLSGGWYTVVGVADDVPLAGFGTGLQPPYTVYLSVLQHPIRSLDLFIPNPSGPPEGVRRAVTGTLRPETLVRTTGASILAAEMAPFNWFGKWFGIEGWATLGVAVMGTFALMRLWVLAIRPELGIRRAVGASRTRLLGYLMTRAIGAALAGVAIGVIFGPSVWESLSTLSPDLPTWDSGVIARYAVILVSAAIAGALPPAWQALREAPVALMGSAGE